MRTNRRLSASERLGTPMLWFGILGGPAAWSAHLLVSYGLVYVVRGGGPVFLLYLTTLLTALIALAAGFAAWRGWRHHPEHGDGEERADEAARRSFMGYTGLLLSGLFFLVILVEGTPPLFLSAQE